jgi:hypothetical protein
MKPSKEELYHYAYNKGRDINWSDTGRYVHKDVYKGIVCPDIKNGIITTFEQADKAIEDIITTNPLDFIGQWMQQELEEQEYDLEADKQYDEIIEFNIDTPNHFDTKLNNK